MIITAYYFSPEDIENPLKITFSDYFYAFNLNIVKTDRIYFKHVDLEEDQGWILEDIEVKNAFAKTDIKSDFSYFDEKDFGKSGGRSMFYTMNFYCQRNYDRIKRSYMKFQEFAAIIGGFMKIVLVFGGILSFLTTNIIRDHKLYNELFEFRKISFPITRENQRVIRNIKKNSTDMTWKPQSEINSVCSSPKTKIGYRTQIKIKQEIIETTERNLISSDVGMSKINFTAFSQNKIEETNLVSSNISKKNYKKNPLVESKFSLVKNLRSLQDNDMIFKFPNRPKNSIEFGICFSMKYTFCFWRRTTKESSNVQIFT